MKDYRDEVPVPLNRSMNSVGANLDHIRELNDVLFGILSRIHDGLYGNPAGCPEELKSCGLIEVSEYAVERAKLNCELAEKICSVLLEGR